MEVARVMVRMRSEIVASGQTMASGETVTMDSDTAPPGYNAIHGSEEKVAVFEILIKYSFT